MEGMRTGLRRRLRRSIQRVEEQHRRMRQIGVELDRALASGGPNAAEAWIARLRDALSAHFDLEEDVIFPALHGLIPTTRPELVQLERDHGAFLEVMAGLLTHESSAPPLLEDLMALRARLDAHEQHEERLMDQVLSESDPEDDEDDKDERST